MNEAPVVRRVRAFFAPVDRVAGVGTVWDPATGFNVDAPPAPWLDLGWCKGFARKSGTKIEALVAGAPGVAVGQVRTAVEAEVYVEFDQWGKLQLALSAGSQQMNVLARPGVVGQTGAAANGSGGAAVGAVALVAGSTASALNVGAAAAFVVGDLVVVDVDYSGQTGYVGSGVSGGYVRTAVSDVEYVRRVSLNVGRVATVANGVLGLEAPLLAGAPAAGMKVSKVVGFCDREGGGFFQEWSGLFVMDGEQGDRVVVHYPRLQAMSGAAEAREGLVGATAKTAMERWRLAGSFRALPVKDASDGETVVCFRSYLPA